MEGNVAAGHRIGLWMKKVGSTAMFDATTGSRVPVTLLLLEDTFVVGTKVSGIHGYDAVVLGTKRRGVVNKPQVQALRKLGIEEDYKLFESRVKAVGDLQPGSKVEVSHFFKGQFVDVTGYTIGRGFAGVMKRHNFRGLRASHGVSISHRSQGSTGQCQDPGRVFKGKKMAGHMGDSKVTMQNLQVMLVDEKESLLVVRGTGIPGAEGSYVFVRDAIKKPVPKGEALSESMAG
ncbi:50S ribosomal protein L3 [Anaplasma phagocytophilum str. CRT38]|uniref:50S ribosomal protein L3 n=2 Tax=Anaplasma phagocytophilum TaxID=948 RepID=S6G6N5_ANAPH|nr:50S ribosomal protein L3 [Anaplasma phagocytophilum str. CRT38]KDB57418.1 50S ribosomal protein L3 [Anaplasma phagocytophilum str. CRT35]